MKISLAVAGVTVAAAAAGAVLATQCPSVEAAIISADQAVVLTTHHVAVCPLGHRISGCGATSMPWRSSGSVSGHPYAMFGITPGDVAQKTESFVTEVGRVAVDVWQAAFSR